MLYESKLNEIYGVLDAENPYTEEHPKYEKDEKAGKYVIVNHYENAKQNTDDAHKAFLPRMWSTEHAANYMDFTGPLEFTIKREYQGQEQLINAVNEFKRSYYSGEIDNEQYDKFLRQFREYIDVEKPSFASNIQYLLE